LGGQYDEGRLAPVLTLGAEAARHAYAPDGTASLEFLSREKAVIGSLVIPLVHNQVLVNFAGPSGTVPSRSLWQVAEGKFSDELFDGKIVLVGSSVASLHDFYHIPLPNKEIQVVGGAQASIHAAQMPGVEIHAHVVRTLLEGKGIQRTSAALVFGLIGLLGTLCCVTVILSPRGEWGVVVATILLLGVVVSAVMFLFFYQNYWVDAVPLLAVLNGHFAMATAYQRYLVVRQKDQLHLMFSHFLSPTIVDSLWRQRASIFDGHRIVPRPLVLTILLVRIRNMAAIIHSLESETLLLWWSRYRRDLTRVLRPYGGLVSAWDDEGVRVFFGAPLPSKSSEAIRHDAQQAVNCAFRVLHATRDHHERWKEMDVPALEILAILYTGSGIGGSIHDSDSPEYRVMGEVTQMTNRLDHWARGCISLQKVSMVLAGEPTVGYLGASWHTEKIGDINEWMGNGTVPIYHIPEAVSPPMHTRSLGEGL
jgi:adenylate cyclase